MVFAAALAMSWVAFFVFGRSYVRQARRLAAAEAALCDVDNAERSAKQILANAQFGACRMIEEARTLLIKADDASRRQLEEVEALSERFAELHQLETMKTLAPPGGPSPWDVTH